MSTENADKLRAMGYEVDVAAEGYQDEGYDHEDGSHVDGQSSPTVFVVNGFGLSNVYVNGDDTDSWQRLLDPDAHQLRIDSEKNTEPNNRDLIDRSIDLSVKFGDITQAEADEAKAQLDVPPMPSAADIFIDAANAVETATDLAGIKSAFSDLKQKLQGGKAVPATTTTKKK